MSTAVYYFNAYDTSEAWAASPANMVDGSTSTYASTSSNGDTQLLTSNTCDGSDLGTITKVEIRVYGYKSGGLTGTIRLTPVFSGGNGNDHDYTATTTATWSSWYDITADTNAPTTWTWTDVDNLDCRVTGIVAVGRTMYAAKVEIQVTYSTAEAGQPMQLRGLDVPYMRRWLPGRL